MKTINVSFEDEELKKLNEQKKEKNWHDFILDQLTSEESPEEFENNIKNELRILFHKEIYNDVMDDLKNTGWYKKFPKKYHRDLVEISMFFLMGKDREY